MMATTAGRLDRMAIASLIPHAGAMVLVDEVVRWDTSRIRCTSRSHRRSDHPLRLNGELAAVHALEYLAQATAVHGALLAGGQAQPRLLAALRKVHLGGRRLDQIEDALEIEAWADGGDAQIVRYGGEVRAGPALVAAARLTLVSVPAIP